MSATLDVLAADSDPPRDDEAPAPEPQILTLVEAARTGDRDAQRNLCKAFERTIYGLAVAKLAPDVAEDIVNDVLVTVLDKLPTLRDPAAFPGWVVTIARNRIADALRAARAPSVRAPLPADSIRDEANVVLAVIRELPEAYAETLVLRFVEGMTGKEIAARTGKTHASVRVNLCRGMKLLREKLSERGHDVG